MRHVAVVGPISLSKLASLVGERGWSGNGMREFGAEVTAHLVAGLVASGRKVTVVTLSPDADDLVTVSIKHVSVIIVPMRGAERLYDGYQLEARRLASAVKLAGAEVVHAHWTHEASVAAISCSQPCIVTVHDRPLKALAVGQSVSDAVSLAIVRKVIRTRRIQIVAVSPVVAKELRLLGAKRVPVVGNGVPTVGMKYDEFRISYGGRRPALFYAVVRGWTRKKNTAWVMRAFRSYGAQGGLGSLVLFGEGQGRGQAAHAWAIRHDAHTDVVFAGEVDNELLLNWLVTHRPTALLHAATVDAGPLAVLEAMSVGIPVVNYDTANDRTATIDVGPRGPVGRIALWELSGATPNGRTSTLPHPRLAAISVPAQSIVILKGRIQGGEHR